MGKVFNFIDDTRKTFWEQKEKEMKDLMDPSTGRVRADILKRVHCPICGVDEFSGKSLGDAWREFDSEKWTVARLEGAIYRRRETIDDILLRAEWNSPTPSNNIKYKAVIIWEMRTRGENHSIRLQLSCMLGENVPSLLKAFVGLDHDV